VTPRGRSRGHEATATSAHVREATRVRALMSIGVYLPISHPRGLPAPSTVLGYAREAEALGLDALWVGDHLLWRTPLLEATTTLAAVAAVTSRIRMGTNVYLLGLRPSLISAKVLGTLAYLAGDRLILGVGVGGEFEEEFQALGVPLEGRGARLDLALEAVHAWWGFGEDGDGPGTLVAPAPDPSLPLWIGGRSDAALRRTIRLRAQAWTAHFVSPEQITPMAARLEELALAADVTVPEVAVTLNINVGEDGAEAREFAEAHFGLPFERIGRHVISGDLDACLERVIAYRNVADHLVLFPASFDVAGQLARIAELCERIRPAWEVPARRPATSRVGSPSADV
jgi:alkanesulfonate monooxygenase SsuD/methylene tetrahydromethanopterin reductase-like flavin-dependent oxidoreductase (luciferase family)